MRVFSILGLALLPVPGFAADALKVKIAPHVTECSIANGACKAEGPEPQVITLEPVDCQGPAGFRVCTAAHFSRFAGFGKAYRSSIVLFLYEEEGQPPRWSISASVHNDDWADQNGVSVKMPALKLYQELSIGTALTPNSETEPRYSGVLTFGPAE